MGVKGSMTRNRKIEPKVAGNWKGARAERFLKVQIPSLASIYRGPVALPMGGEGAIKGAKPGQFSSSVNLLKRIINEHCSTSLVHLHFKTYCNLNSISTFPPKPLGKQSPMVSALVLL